MYQFFKVVVDVYFKVYLRDPNVGDTDRLLSINKSQGGSRDAWKHRLHALEVP
jgi:hypothetical protein